MISKFRKTINMNKNAAYHNICRFETNSFLLWYFFVLLETIETFSTIELYKYLCNKSLYIMTRKEKL